MFVQSVLLTAVGFINAGNAFHDDSEFKKDSALIYASTIVASLHRAKSLSSEFLVIL